MSVNKEELLNGFSGLSLDEQVEVAQMIWDSLLKQDVYDWDEELLDNLYLFTLSNKKDEKLREMNEAFKDFSRLSAYERICIIDSFIDSVNYHVEKMERKEKILACEKKGHKFDSWVVETEVISEEKVEDKKSSYVTVPSDVPWYVRSTEAVEGRTYHIRQRKKLVWYRECKECGFIQKTDSEAEMERLSTGKARVRRP